MALTPIRQMDLSIHGKMLSVIESLLADSAVSTDKLAANAVTEAKIAAGTITNASLAQTASISDAALAIISTAGKVANSATTAASANTADAIVARDANGAFSAGDVNVVDLSASGDLSVTGSSTLSGTLSVVGTSDLAATNMSGDLNIGAGNLVVTASTGTVNMTGLLYVNDDVNLSSDLFVTGAASLSSTLAVAGDLSVDTNKFTVAAATGNTIVGGTLSVSGESTLTGNVSALGDVTIQGNLAVNGTTTSVNSVDLVVNDKLIHLNEPSVLGANDPVPTGLAGISVHRGSDAGVEREHAGLVWDEAGQKFVFQLLDADAAGSAKLDLEAKDISAQSITLNAVNGAVSSDIESSAYDFDMRFNNGNNEGNFEVDADGARLDMFDLNNGLYAQFHKDQFHVERTADNYATYSQFDINPDGVQWRDGANNPLMPLNDEHLVVKKYVDDAGDALQANIDLKFNKAGGAIDTNGVVTFDSSANNSTLSLGAESVQLHYESGDLVSEYLLSNYFEVSLNDSASGGSTGFRVDQDVISIQRSADNDATWVTVDFNADGISMLDETLAPVMPQADEHLVVKKYVDDADAGLQDSVDELYDKSGIVAGTQNTYSTTNVVANGDSLLAAIGKIDDALADVAGKSYHEAFIYEAVGGETSLNKPVAAPAIPDSAFTEVYIDGRKVFRGADKQFTVAVGGGSIDFAALTAGQTVELRYFA